MWFSIKDVGSTPCYRGEWYGRSPSYWLQLCALILVAFTFIVGAQRASATGIAFDSSGELTASQDFLDGKFALTLRSEQAVYNAVVFARAQGERQEVARLEYWHPGDTHEVSLHLPSPHRYGGEYHLLVEIAFQDMLGSHLSSSLALSYPVHDDVALRPPGLELVDTKVRWSGDTALLSNAQVVAFPPPPWGSSIQVLTPADQSTALLPAPEKTARPNWLYRESARLTWVDNGIHASRILGWAVATDSAGRALNAFAAHPHQVRDVNFNAEASLTATQTELFGEITLHFTDSDPLLDVKLSILGTDATAHDIGKVATWAANTPLTFPFTLPATHDYPGLYHALVHLTFEDATGHGYSATLPLEYRVERAASAPANVNVSLEKGNLIWDISGVDDDHVFLAVSSEPAWHTRPIYTPLDKRLELAPNGLRSAVPNWHYPQQGRLEWVQDGQHFSRMLEWAILTDAQGQWNPQRSAEQPRSPWRNPLVLWILAGIATVVAVALFLIRRRAAASDERTRTHEWVGGATLVVLTAWLISHSSPDLWWERTWSTGGDVASQVFYARIFMEWFPSKISGWLPESFAGFPAFTFYFPFPFMLSAIFALPFGEQIGFKLASMLAAFLLPAGTYIMGALWRWPVTVRLLAAAGAAAFILTEVTSIWGGNALAQLAGEFAYSWGILNTTLFWGLLALALRRGGRWWLLAGVWEAVVAISHGYALLIAGFGAFLFLLHSRRLWPDLLLILRVHTFAFLLIGFWLMPLFENLPWTIPNDTTASVDKWQILWPPTLWPLTVGIIPLLLAMRASRHTVHGLSFLVGVCFLGLLGFFSGHNVGLAELRFFPFAQWALAVGCAAAIGWALQRYLKQSAVAFAVAAVMALAAWWEPYIQNLEGWSRWNLSGYETKPMWPHFFLTAQTNAGPIDGPRVIFEHDPDNNDIGSTRALEALPMFGSRPALEGLYMESSITSPFIYQLQEEISRRPSAPLSRYPTTPRPVDAAVAHLNELYTNRLILRSPLMKGRYGDDPRFELINEAGPFRTYELLDFRAKLVEVAAEPLVPRDRERWMDHAFRRFVLAHPYTERHVYLSGKQQLPVAPAGPADPQVKITEFSRERFVFETTAPGQPHLIRMTYHPRWRSTSGETVYLTEPSFMLIFPSTQRVELVYGWSWGNWVGFIFTTLALGILAFGLARTGPWNRISGTGEQHRSPRPLVVFAAVCSLTLSISWWTDPEHVYFRGHRYFANEDWLTAARFFDDAQPARKNPANRAEALFWAARSYQLGAKKDDALRRYSELRDTYPESFWYAESVFRLIELYRERGDDKQVTQLNSELQQRLPNSRWAGEARTLLGEVATGP